ncbi:hypothetical protein, partial [Ralstonia solanacearum]|uniref:hypothetical protein n=1 Tax=Ralstonia solanacearum TaxID=305 RepID=UPI001E311E4E
NRGEQVSFSRLLADVIGASARDRAPAGEWVPACFHQAGNSGVGTGRFLTSRSHAARTKGVCGERQNGRQQTQGENAPDR